MQNNPAFRIVVAYEDSTAAVHVREILGPVLERVGVQMESDRCDAWPFEMLAVARLREGAITITGEADMIIVAARGAVELPVAVKNWLENSLLQNESDPVALVALLHDDWMMPGGQSPLCAYLRQVAERENMVFFCSLGGRTRRNAIEGIGRLPNRSSMIMMHSETAPEYSAAREWGIND